MCTYQKATILGVILIHGEDFLPGGFFSQCELAWWKDECVQRANHVRLRREIEIGDAIEVVVG